MPALRCRQVRPDELNVDLVRILAPGEPTRRYLIGLHGSVLRVDDVRISAA